jgi:hypothetical protein
LQWGTEEGAKVYFDFDSESQPAKMIVEMLQGENQEAFIRKK